MPVLVIQWLEVIQIDKHQGPVFAGALAAGLRLVQSVDKQAAVGELGERVIERQLPYLVLQLLTLGDFPCDAVKSGDFSVFVPHCL